MLKDLLLRLIRLLVGGLFIFSGLIKVNDPVGTAIKLEEYFDVFSYDIAGFFEMFKPWALEIGVVMVVAEVVLGVMLIVGFKLRFTVWALGLMILFFTFLTFYSAYFNKVTDCGCFGDAIKLTPWESFYKDIVLLVMILILFLSRKSLKDNRANWALWTASFSLVFSISVAILAIRNLPFIDFRAYKEGVNIPQAMQPSAPLEYSYVMQKDGKEEIFDQYPSDEAYEFVELKLNNEEALPKISDFAVWNEDGDYTEEILSGQKAVVLATNLAKVTDNSLSKLERLVTGLQNSEIEVILVAASSQPDIDAFLNQHSWDVLGYQADATVLKTIMRSNPGLLLLDEGTVVKKYHFRNTPNPEEVKSILTK
ncbi:BT_3928 family protein [Belliella kenyensis]|uniref:BT_3928 family protein n=1 Tax=Belliella kenyensis TaxID=1472724 RepID=A0ABV8EGX6_9BACT|nr:BT_3928 family protein [Belliella kenyensis]MCH7403076.1 DoxX family membrane protein [Belliella kenyensis]MDN3602245.1 DoxX family membrane protein [Belliella kenyensis]